MEHMAFIDKLKRMLGLGGGTNGVAADLQQQVETQPAQDTAADESAAAADQEQQAKDE